MCAKTITDHTPASATSADSSQQSGDHSWRLRDNARLPPVINFQVEYSASRVATQSQKYNAQVELTSFDTMYQIGTGRDLVWIR